MDNKKTTYMTKSDIVLKTLENKRFGEPKKVIKEESTYSEYNKKIEVDAIIPKMITEEDREKLIEKQIRFKLKRVKHLFRQLEYA